MPSGNVTVTVDFGSACPVMCLLSLVTSSTDGLSGAVVSVTVTVFASDVLPSLSAAVTLISSSPFNSTSSGMSTV